MANNSLTYTHANTLLEHFVAKPQGEAKGVVVFFPPWRGRDSFICEQATRIVQKGWIGIGADLYGKGIVGNTDEECAKLMDPFMEDRNFLKDRLFAALDAIVPLSPKKIIVCGFCFGGLCALDVVRNCYPNVMGCASFHGILQKPNTSDSKPIQAKILILHGDKDPLVPRSMVSNFQQEMDERKATWHLKIYSNAAHAFTNPLANDPKKGLLYEPTVAKDAFEELDRFLEHV